MMRGTMWRQSTPAKPIKDEDAEWLRTVVRANVELTSLEFKRLDRIANRLSSLPPSDAITPELAELRAFKTRVLAAVEFVEKPSAAQVDAAVRDDLAAGMSLRKCAAKHGLTFGQVRGAAMRNAGGVE